MNAKATYRTIAAPSRGEYKEKGSKFLAFAFPVDKEEKIRYNLEALRSQYHDARHYCYAWILGYQGEIFRANDDGEPGHSAGDPILGQLKSKDLTHVLCVVVRYFGGTKLGVSGLIHAYKTATEEALENAKIVERQITTSVSLQYAYEATNEVMRLLDDFELMIDEQEFGADCRMQARVNISWKEALHDRIQLLASTGNEVRLIARDTPS